MTRLRRAARVPTAAALLLSACGAAQPQGPYYGDERYLVLGVQPDAEAVALVQQLALAGYPLHVRVSGQNFTALGFLDERGSPSRVRVITSRGIEVALDPEPSDVLHQGMSYALLEAPLSETNDADGDGFEELFVEEQLASGEPPCIRVYRVRDSGFVDKVEETDYALARPAEAKSDAWRDPTFCAGSEPSAEAEENSTPENTAEHPAAESK